MRFTIFSILCVSLLTATPSSAEIVRALSRSGSGSIEIPANYDSNSAVLYTVISGSITQAIELSLQAPPGVTLGADSRVIGRGETVAKLIDASTGWNSQRFMTNSGSESTTYRALSDGALIPLPGDGGGGGVSPGECGGLSEADIQRIIVEAGASGITLTREIICQMFNAQGLTSAPAALSTYTSTGGRMILHKDTCATNSRSKQLVRLKLNTSRVDPALKAQGYTVSVAARPQTYRGKKAASLKPKSEGRFAPQPLFLMTSLNGWGKQKINIVEWSRGKIARIRTTNTADFVYHAGKFLTRTPAGRFMSGKKATVELTNGQAMYSVCFTLTRRRQNVNGY